MKIVLKIFIYAVLILIVLVVALLLFIQSQWFKDKLVDVVENKLENVFYGKVEIGKVDGDFLRTITIRDIEYIDSGGNKIISIQELGLTYRIKELFSKIIHVNDFYLTNTDIQLVKSDSTWNISGIIIPNNKEKENKPFTWKIKVDKTDINDFEVYVTSPDSTLPKSFRTDLDVDFLMENRKMNINLNSIQFITHTPDLEVKKGYIFFEKNKNLLSIKDLSLETDQSFVRLKGYLSPDNMEEGNIDLKTKIAFQELGKFVNGLNREATPEIQIQALLKNGDLDAEIGVQEKKQSLNGRIQLLGLLKQKSLKTKLDFNHINISDWISKEELKSDLSGGLDVESNSLKYKSNDMKGTFFLANTPVKGIGLDSLFIRFDKKNDAVQSQLMLLSGKSKGEFEIGLTDIYNDPGYDVKGDLYQLNIGKILNNKKLDSEVNMKIAFSGKGRTPETASLNLDTEIEKAVYADFKIENSIIKLMYDKGNYDIHDFQVHSTAADMRLMGKGRLKDSTRLYMEMRIKDLSTLKQFVGNKEIMAAGYVKAQVSGNIDSLVSELQFDFSQVVADTIQMDALSGEMALNIFPERKQFMGNGEILADNLEYGKYRIEKLAINSDFSEKQYNNLIQFESRDSANGSINLNVNVEADPLFNLENMDLYVFGHNWKGGSDSSEVQLFEDKIAIRNVDLKSEDQKIFINGVYSFEGEEDLKMDIKNIRIDKLPFIEKVKGQPKGILNLDLDLQGSAGQPEILGDLLITEGSLKGISIDTLSLKLNYASDNLHLAGSLAANNTHLLSLFAEVPYHLSFIDSIQKVDKYIPVKVSLKTDSLDLDFISSILDNKNLKMAGMLIADFKIDGSPADPVFTGFLNLNGGNFQFREYGINYHDVVLKSGFRDNKYVIDSLRILSGKKGKLLIKGEAALGNSTKKPLDEFSVNLVGSDFQLAKSALADVEFNTNMNLKGTLDDPVFHGELNIKKARINIDELMRRSGRKPKKVGTPMLVEAINDSLAPQIKKDTVTFTIDSTKYKSNGFLKKLHGDFTIDMPGTVWVRGNDMNLQLDGNLKITKKDWDIRYFGEVDAKRGYYKLYGRKLVVDEAYIKFQGEKTINPILNLHVYYKFRMKNKSGNDNLKIMNIKVSGTLKDPLVNFDLDGKGIEKEDAISYLIFGMKMDDLDFSQQSQMPNSTEDIAKDVGFSMLASMLQSSLGQSIGIDVIEIESDDNWETAPVTLGKYITNFLYMSYTYTFSLTNEKKDVEPYKLVLEYQVLRNLFLQGSNSGKDSGFDVFLKFGF
jgi:autotransporter translocation and assembly factor TamB